MLPGARRNSDGYKLCMVQVHSVIVIFGTIKPCDSGFLFRLLFAPSEVSPLLRASLYAVHGAV